MAPVLDSLYRLKFFELTQTLQDVLTRKLKSSLQYTDIFEGGDKRKLRLQGRAALHWVPWASMTLERAFPSYGRFLACDDEYMEGLSIILLPPDGLSGSQCMMCNMRGTSSGKFITSCSL